MPLLNRILWHRNSLLFKPWPTLLFFTSPLFDVKFRPGMQLCPLHPLNCKTDTLPLLLHLLAYSTSFNASLKPHILQSCSDRKTLFKAAYLVAEHLQRHLIFKWGCQRQNNKCNPVFEPQRCLCVMLGEVHQGRGDKGWWRQSKCPSFIGF